VRLNKLLSQHGVASRRLADDLIRQGRVEVGGQVVDVLGTRVDPERDEIRVDGRRIRAAAERRYLLLNKPRGVVSSRRDPQRRRTVIDLLSERGIDGYFFPVGRLDYDSEGLIILTNDGDFAARVTHPRYELPRTYEAVVAGVPDARDLDRLRRGVLIDGRRSRPADVRCLRVKETRQGPQAVLSVTLREGRNRQVRRMCDAIAHPVERLRRTHIGPLTDRTLRPGQARDLTIREIRALTGAGGRTSSTVSQGRKHASPEARETPRVGERRRPGQVRVRHQRRQKP
jgi:23S rRNA pseudouridine2605 synthase